jgi:peptidoglycan/xylan/chitin deacetylase (PgdA/CDA1 family)
MKILPSLHRSRIRPLAWLAALLCCAGLASAQGGELKVVLRYDDYSAGSRTETERALFRLTHELGIGVLVGVIPFSAAAEPTTEVPAAAPDLFLPPEKLALLKEYAALNAIEIGIHGFVHADNRGATAASEFAGLPVERQYRLLRTAKAAMESAARSNVRLFIPPFNTYDENTLRALDQAGYRLLSAGAGGPVLEQGALTYLPGGPYPQRLKDAIATALARGHTDALVVSTLHPYDIVGSVGSLPEFRRGAAQLSLDELQRSLTDLKGLDGVRFVGIDRIFEEDLSAQRLQSNLRLNTSLVTRYRLVPEALNTYPLPGLYYSTDGADRLYRSQLLWLAAIYGTLFALVTALSRTVVHLLSSRWRSVRGVALAMGGAGISAVVLASHYRGFYLSVATVLTCSLGLLLGSALARRRVHGSG